MNEYRYEELREAATKNPTGENLTALGEWLQQYGDRYWNGGMGYRQGQPSPSRVWAGAGRIRRFPSRGLRSPLKEVTTI